MSMDDAADIAKNVAAIAGCIVAVVAVYRLPLVNNILRRLARYLFTIPISSWAQNQVRTVVSPQIKEATAWLAESQDRMGGEVQLLRERLDDDGNRLADIDSRTLQLLPNGGKSIYDRLTRMEVALGTCPDTAALMLAQGPVEIHGTITEVPPED